ncbi:hypothetical protein GCM10027051_03240 [Niabella terrae]
MKSSNTLLIVILLLLFSIPLLLAGAFKSAIKNQRYRLENNQGFTVEAPTRTDAFKVIKIDGLELATGSIAPLKCHIQKSDSYGYLFDNYDPQNPVKNRSDSCSISQKGDTLEIHYNIKKDVALQPQNFYTGIDIQLFLPDTATIIAQGVTLELNSLTGDLPSSLKLDLSRGAELIMRSVLLRRAELKDSLTESKRARLNDYHISSGASKINISGFLHFNQLNILADSKSSLEISDDVHIDRLKTDLDDLTKVDMSYGLLRKAQP